MSSATARPPRRGGRSSRAIPRPARSGGASRAPTSRRCSAALAAARAAQRALGGRVRGAPRADDRALPARALRAPPRGGRDHPPGEREADGGGARHRGHDHARSRALLRAPRAARARRPAPDLRRTSRMLAQADDGAPRCRSASSRVISPWNYPFMLAAGLVLPGARRRQWRALQALRVLAEQRRAARASCWRKRESPPGSCRCSPAMASPARRWSRPGWTRSSSSGARPPAGRSR